MRKAMICVSVMLLLLQIWPMIFGHRAGEASAAVSPEEAPRPIAAVATATVIPIPAKASAPGNNAPKSCYSHYQALFATCSKDDQSCLVNATDKWDLCEATGFWPS